jgi:hypothetical protein
LSTCTTLTNSSLVTNEEAAISDIVSANSLINFVNDTTNSQNNNDGNIIAAATFEPDKFIFINSIAEPIAEVPSISRKSKFIDLIYHQCPDEIVPDKSTSTTLRNTPLTYKHDSAGSFSITGNQLNRVYVRARDYANS